MDVMGLSVITDDAHQICFGHCAVDIADDQFILKCVKVDLGLQSDSRSFEDDLVFSVLQV